MTEKRSEATAVLDIMDAKWTRRVMAVNIRGRPLQYRLRYEVLFSLRAGGGKMLLEPQSIEVQRSQAYNVRIELGASRRRKQLLRDMQNEAARLIMLRLQASSGEIGKDDPGRN